MDATKAPELGSTGKVETSRFQGLSAGKTGHRPMLGPADTAGGAGGGCLAVVVGERTGWPRRPGGGAAAVTTGRGGAVVEAAAAVVDVDGATVDAVGSSPSPDTG